MSRIIRKCLTVLAVAVAVAALPAAASATTTVSGTVSVGSGSTVRAPGATISIAYWTGSKFEWTSAHTTTNASGNYVMKGLANNWYYELYAGKSSYYCPGTLYKFGGYSSYFLANGAPVNAAIHLELIQTLGC